MILAGFPGLRDSEGEASSGRGQRSRHLQGGGRGREGSVNGDRRQGVCISPWNLHWDGCNFKIRVKGERQKAFQKMDGV